MNKKEYMDILDDFESNNWKHLDFKGQLEEFSYGEHEISPPQSFYMEPKPVSFCEIPNLEGEA